MVRSRPPNPEVPGSIRGLNIWVIFFHVKVHSAFQPSGVGKMNTNIIYINRFEAASRGAYIGGKLIIVKPL